MKTETEILIGSCDPNKLELTPENTEILIDSYDQNIQLTQHLTHLHGRLKN